MKTITIEDLKAEWVDDVSNRKPYVRKEQLPTTVGFLMRKIVELQNEMVELKSKVSRIKHGTSTNTGPK